MSSLVPITNPSYQAALAAGIGVGDSVVVLCTVPILYRTEVVKRTVVVTAMSLYTITVKNPTNLAMAALPWAQLYGYFESS